MRILIVSHRFFPAEGGSERWALGLARALAHRGDRPIVLTQRESGVPDAETVGGIEIHRIGMRTVGRFRQPEHYLRTLRELDFDLLHLSGNRIWSADYLFPIAPFVPQPKAITTHGFYQLEMKGGLGNRLYFERYLPFALRSFGAYLALTDHEVEQIVSFGYDPRRVHLVGEGIDFLELTDTPASSDLRAQWKITRRSVAISCGGTWENKRLDRVLAGIAPLRRELALVVTGRDVAGSPYDRAYLESRAHELGIEFRYVGPLARPEQLAALRAADVYVQGSSYEGFGLALLEALGSGLTFVAYPTGVAPALAGLGGGRIATDPLEFADAVRETLAHRAERREEVAARARLLARSWDWNDVVERYAAIYRSLASD